jgi:hypothetical protein
MMYPRVGVPYRLDEVASAVKSLDTRDQVIVVGLPRVNFIPIERTIVYLQIASARFGDLVQPPRQISQSGRQAVGIHDGLYGKARNSRHWPELYLAPIPE